MFLRRVVTFCLLAASTFAAGLCSGSSQAFAPACLVLDASAATLAEYAHSPLCPPADPALRQFGRKITDPELFNSTAAADVKTLPAVPAAVALTLLGFFCVSLTRDRRVWLASAAAVIALGHTGAAAIPQLMQRIAARTVAQTAQNTVCAAESAAFETPCNLSQPVRYAGLLRKLDAIPHRSAAPATDTSNQNVPSAVMPPAALAHSLAACPAQADADFTCFSPAFIFAVLSRGPPHVSL